MKFFFTTSVLPDIYTETILPGKNDTHILAFCFRDAHTAKEIAEELGIKPSTYFRQSVLSRLVNSGFLKQIHGEKAALYQSNPNQVFVQKR